MKITTICGFKIGIATYKVILKYLFIKYVQCEISKGIIKVIFLLYGTSFFVILFYLHVEFTTPKTMVQTKIGADH